MSSIATSRLLHVPLQESSEKQLACLFLVSEAASYYFFCKSGGKSGRAGRLAAFGVLQRGGWLPLVLQT